MFNQPLPSCVVRYIKLSRQQGKAVLLEQYIKRGKFKNPFAELDFLAIMTKINVIVYSTVQCDFECEPQHHKRGKRKLGSRPFINGLFCFFSRPLTGGKVFPGLNCCSGCPLEVYPSTCSVLVPFESAIRRTTCIAQKQLANDSAGCLRSLLPFCAHIFWDHV